MKLTNLETKVLETIAKDETHDDHGPDSPIWVDVPKWAADPLVHHSQPQIKGALSSLSQKGLIFISQDEEINGERESTVCITAAGMDQLSYLYEESDADPFEAEAAPVVKAEVVDPEEFSPLAFMLAGNATFTIHNPKTGNRCTYKVKIKREGDDKSYFVSLLNGPDNWENYMYIGMIYWDAGYSPVYRLTRGSKARENALSQKMFMWTFDRLVKGASLGPVEVLHSGKCGRCGRKLTVPESIKSGFGPECINKVFSG